MAKIARPTKPLADVNVLPQKDGSLDIVVCFMPDVDLLVGEGNSKAFLALDASASMKKMYGFGGPFGGDPNYVQAVARKLGAILTSVCRSGKVNGIYWAVSADGAKIEEIGEWDEASWKNAVIAGPKKERWGRGTKLLPVIQFAVEKIAKDAQWTMGVILTDGIIEDEAESIKYCLKLGKEMADGKRKPLKLVLIGIGEEVDESQLERFDNMFEKTDIKYDLWSHGTVASMQEESDILGVLYGELMTEEVTVTPTGRVEDSSGKVVATWSDGLPGKFRFKLGKGETKFVIRTPQQDIEQDISEAIEGA
jgi:hypothetical protein